MTSLGRFIIPAVAGLALGALVDAATPAPAPGRGATCPRAEAIGAPPPAPSGPRESTHARGRRTSSLGDVVRGETGCARRPATASPVVAMRR